MKHASGASATNGGVNNNRKTRNNLPKEITFILLQWLNDHLNHPYPSSFEKSIDDKYWVEPTTIE